MTREFHLGDVLTITTGYLVAPGRMQAVHELLDYMTGDTLFTHQLPRAIEECAPALLAQHPQLDMIYVPGGFTGEQHVECWLAELVAVFGERLPVVPLADGDHTQINPLTEMAMNHPLVKAIAAEIPEGGAA